MPSEVCQIDWPHGDGGAPPVHVGPSQPAQFTPAHAGQAANVMTAAISGERDDGRAASRINADTWTGDGTDNSVLRGVGAVASSATLEVDPSPLATLTERRADHAVDVMHRSFAEPVPVARRRTGRGHEPSACRDASLRVPAESACRSCAGTRAAFSATGPSAPRARSTRRAAHRMSTCSHRARPAPLLPRARRVAWPLRVYRLPALVAARCTPD